MPLQWAATQNNLGTAFTTLGRRKKQPQLLRDALEAVSRATEVYGAAGMVQDEADLTDRISALKVEIAAMEAARLP